MARNFVEYHIQEGSFHTLKVEAGQTAFIGQFVEVAGDRTVQPAGAGSNKVVGMVYSGTVGIDGLNDGYEGDEGHVVTVIALKPLVYAQAGGAVSAGANLETNADGNVVTSVDGQKVGLALEGATAGERFLVQLA